MHHATLSLSTGYQFQRDSNESLSSLTLTDATPPGHDRWLTIPEHRPPLRTSRPPATDTSGHFFKDKPWPRLKQTRQATVVLVVAYMSVASLGLVSNIFVVVVVMSLPSMRNVTNIFLANLALADILVCIFVLPITLLENIYTEWEFGPLVCKMFPYLQGVSINGSVNTLGVVAIERYLAVSRSPTSRIKQKSASLVIVFVWFVPLLLFVPWIVAYEQTIFEIHGQPYVACHANWSSELTNQVYTMAVVFLACYLLPLVCIGMFYICIGIKVSKRKVPGANHSLAGQNLKRSKKRILTMLIAVTSFFALSWLPFYSLSVFFLFSKSGRELKTFLKDHVKPFAQWLAASNSCVNPFIYCYFNAHFRKSMIDLMNRLKNFLTGRDDRNLKLRRPASSARKINLHLR